MAAGEATLRGLTPDVYAAIDRRADRLEEALAGPGRSTARVGSLLTLFFRERPPRDFGEAKESDTAAFGRFFRSMKEAGVLLPPSQYEAWFLSAAHDDAVVDETIRAIPE